MPDSNLISQTKRYNGQQEAEQKESRWLGSSLLKNDKKKPSLSERAATSRLFRELCAIFISLFENTVIKSFLLLKLEH